MVERRQLPSSASGLTPSTGLASPFLFTIDASASTATTAATTTDSVASSPLSISTSASNNNNSSSATPSPSSPSTPTPTSTSTTSFSLSSSSSSSASSTAPTSTSAFSVFVTVGKVHIPLGLVVAVGAAVVVILGLVIWCITLRFRSRREQINRKRRLTGELIETTSTSESDVEQQSDLPYLRPSPLASPDIVTDATAPRSVFKRLPHTRQQSSSENAVLASVPYPSRAIPTTASPYSLQRERGNWSMNSQGPNGPKPLASYSSRQGINYPTLLPPPMSYARNEPGGLRVSGFARNFDRSPAQVGLPYGLERALD